MIRMGQKLPRVFVLEQTRHDVERLESFGRIVYMFNDHDRSGYFDIDFIDDIAEKLKDLRFDPDIDFFAFVGSQIAIGCTSVVLTELHSSFNALCYDSRDNTYYKKTMCYEQRR